MPAADHLCACLAPTGAGLYTGAFKPAVLTPSQFTEQPEASYPIGSRANLAAPFPVDRGVWQEPRLASVFVKTPNGRWTSYPGNDVNYPTLRALTLAAPVVSIDLPPEAAPAQAQQYSMATIPAPDTEAEAAAQEIAQAQAQAAAPRFNPLWLLAGAAALALVFFARRR